MVDCSCAIRSPLAVTLWTRLLNLPGNGSRHVGPVKGRQKKRLTMSGRGVVAARCLPPASPHLPVDTKDDAGAGGVLLTPTKHYEEDFGVVSSPFLLKLSLLLVCFLSWNSVISLILKFKYINFYLCISILVRVCLCVSDSEGVWCTQHTLWGLVRACGCKKFKKKSGCCTEGVDWLQFLQKQTETFWFLPLSVLWLVFCQSVSQLWSLAQYE